MAALLKGIPVASSIDEKTKLLSEELSVRGITPKLVLVRVGEKEADLAYERNIEKRCAKTGITVEKLLFDVNAGTEELTGAVRKLNEDPSVHGVLFFMPFPKEAKIDAVKVKEVLSPQKDVDGCTARSNAGIFMDTGVGFAPCTAQACMEILSYYNIGTEGKRAVIVGRSPVVGKPLAMLMLRKNATVTVCHSKTRDLADLTRKADILVTAIGKGEFFDLPYLGKGQTVIDVGINWNEEKGKITGDVSEAAAEEAGCTYTPVPGGVGSVTTSVLCAHVAEAAKMTAGSI